MDTPASAAVDPLKASAGGSGGKNMDENLNIVVVSSGDPERVRGDGNAETEAADPDDRKAGNEGEACKIPVEEVEEEQEEEDGTGEDSATKALTSYGYSDARKPLEDDGKVVEETRSSRLKRAIVKQIWQPKKREWRLILFVLFLFVVIVAGLVVIYHLHREELYYIYHHHNVTLHKTQLDVRFRNAAGAVVLTGTLWKDSPPRGKPYDCSLDQEEEEGHGEGQGSRRLCLLWKTVRRLEIDHFQADGGAVCNRIRWYFLSPDASDDNSDCFDLGGDGVKWFGAGILKNTSDGTLDAASIARQAFVTGGLHDRGAFGPVAERIFLSSEGVGIAVEANSSLELSVNAPDRQLCLHSPAYPVSVHPVFGYVVCIGESVTKVRRDVLSLLVQNSTYQLPPRDLFDRPVWSTWAYLKDRYNETSLLDFADEIRERFTGGRPLMMIDEGWEVETGDLEFTTSKFNDPRSTVKALHERNFLASLEVRAQVSTRSSAFENATIQSHLVTSLGGYGDVPALARRWSGPHEPRWERGLTGVYDLAGDDDAGALLAARLTRLRDEVGFDAFHIAGTEASSLPAQSVTASSADRNEHTRRAVEVASSLGHPLSIVESASGAQKLSPVIRLAGGTSSWDGAGGLRSIIPSALTLGLLGYPVFIAEPVGGSAYDGYPTKELFLRWFQVSAFLPVVHLSVPPWHYDNETQTAVEKLLHVRANLVLPEIQSILRKEPSDLIHSPIVRPIWWLDPADEDVLGVVTEFLVGDNILVAPVLEEGRRQRDVYLPRGLWRDLSLGVNHSGPRWLRGYAVNMTSVAYFIRQ